MQSFGGLLGRDRCSNSISQPILGCMIAQQPLPKGITRLRDRNTVTGTVLVEQPDESMQHQGREALQYSITSFHAETKLPTRYGQYRVRAYRHSVRTPSSGMTVQHGQASELCLFVWLHVRLVIQKVVESLASSYTDGWRQLIHRTHGRHDWAARGTVRGKVPQRLVCQLCNAPSSHSDFAELNVR